ncbi:MAG TPA: FecR family protein [Candidatus Ozemobacteraceae bacterium]|nr:FecR family protein [Candidatus Ozemobacteraceae bacterium]
MRTLLHAIIGIILLSGLLLTGCGNQPSTATKDPLAFVEKIEKGEAFVKRAGETTFNAASVKAQLHEGDIVKTGDTGEVVIRFATGAVARVLAKSEYQLKERKVATTGQNVVYTRLVTGVAAFYVPKDAEAAKKFEVETERAVASIKGTTFKLADDGSTTTLSVGEGTVNFTAKAGGKSVDVAEMYRVSANATGLSEPEKFNTLMDPDLAGAEEIMKGTR